MKTSVIMIRRMGDFEVSQRTKDGMFNATILIKQWNKREKKKVISNFLSLEKTKEFIQEIENDHIQKTELGLNELQKKLAFACDMGYINSFEKLLEEMRRIYSLKVLTN